MRLETIVLGIVVASISRAASSGSGEANLPEPLFYHALSLAAKALGIDAFVFTASDYDVRTGILTGYRLENNHWKRQFVPLPDIVYDRCFFRSFTERRQHYAAMADMRSRKPYQWLNGKLPSKLQVYEALSGKRELLPYLPVTELYRSADQLSRMIAQYPEGIVMKPAAGMQGRGVVHVKRAAKDSAVAIAGSSRQLRPFALKFDDLPAATTWIERFVKRSAFVIQPYLQLAGSDGRPFDIRVLMQKDKDGRWRPSGSAARLGQVGSVASNLHGGGDAAPAVALLAAKLGEAKAERLLEEIHTICRYTTKYLERCFGRFAELAFDFGVEPDGKLWLLEVNSKPGRASFRLIRDADAEKQSIERLLHYSRFLTHRLSPTFTANEFANGRFRHWSLNNRLRPFNVQEVHR